MAQPPVFLNAKRSNRLLWRQQLREQQAQAALASVRAARNAAEHHLEAMRQTYVRAAEYAKDATRNRWEEAAGKLMTADMLNAVRGMDVELGDQVRQAAMDILDAQRSLDGFAPQIEAATAIVAKECAQTLHRERVATYCKIRVMKIVAHREERALEDDLVGRETYLS